MNTEIFKENFTDETVLVFAPTLNDSSLAVEVLTENGIRAVQNKSLGEFCDRLKEGCGAAVISEEAISINDRSCLQEALDCQPKWSDIPVILLIGSDTDRGTVLFSKTGNVSLLVKPFS